MGFKISIVKYEERTDDRGCPEFYLGLTTLTTRLRPVDIHAPTSRWELLSPISTMLNWLQMVRTSQHEKRMLNFQNHVRDCHGGVHSLCIHRHEMRHKMFKLMHVSQPRWLMISTTHTLPLIPACCTSVVMNDHTNETITCEASFEHDVTQC